MSDLFGSSAAAAPKQEYDASQIEVLEGLEPVRMRPGMYIGGTDERAYHHLAGEVLDNSMDEAVAGHADWIEVTLETDGSLVIRDNGRGIPVDEHPKFPGKSALEVISVVNALSDRMWIEVAKNKKLYKQSYSKGHPTSKLEDLGDIHNRRGTTVSFHPDPEIFGDKLKFKPGWLYKMLRSKAYLYSGVEIRWKCDPSLIPVDSKVPAEDVLHFPGGLKDYLAMSLQTRGTLTPQPFHGKVDLPDGEGRIEFAIAWPRDGEGFSSSYCNTIPTPLGGTHESGLKTALSRGLRNYGEMTGNKKAAQVTADDIVGGSAMLLSIFIRDPQFQGQTKEKLVSSNITKLVDNAIRDHFDIWLSSDPAASNILLQAMIERAEERKRKREEKTVRKSATRKLRLPGKLSDCSRNSADDTEIFIVEGDSAGGSAKQGRNRETQAILPLRGKILNVVSASADKIKANTEIQDLAQAPHRQRKAQ